MRQLLKNIIFHKQFQKLSVYGFGQLFNLVTPLLVVPYIVTICGEENFGKTAVGMSIAFFLIVFVDYSSDITGVREVSVNRNSKSELEDVFITTYALKFFIFILVFIISLLLIFNFSYFQSEKTLFLFSLAVLLGQFVSPIWFLQGIENVKWITVYNIVSKIIYLGLVFFFVKKENDYIYVNLFWGIGMFLSGIVFLIKIIIKHQFSFFNIKIKSVRDLLKKDFSMFSSQIFLSLHLYAPVIIISYFGNNLMAGQYKIVDQIIVIFKTYIFLFFNYVFPKVCFELDTNKKIGFKNWKLFNGMNFIFILISMVFIYIYAYEIISYFNPTNRYLLTNLLQVAVFIPLLLSISIPLKQLVLAENHKRFYIMTTYMVVLVNLITIFFLLPVFEVYSVFYSLLFTELLVIFFYLYSLKEFFNKNDKKPFSKIIK
jgi:O-antigen/teichoic acid export membrane protein